MRDRHIGNKVTEIKYVTAGSRSESPSDSVKEESSENSKKYYTEALRLAQNLSKKWGTLREKKAQDPNLLYGFPKLDEIDAMSRPPVSGIQKWFEFQIQFISEHASGDENVRSRMIYRILEDLRRVEEQVNKVVS